MCYKMYKNALCSLDSCSGPSPLRLCQGSIVTWQRVTRIKGSWRGKNTGKWRKFRGILLLLHVLGLQPINESALSTAQQVKWTVAPSSAVAKLRDSKRHARPLQELLPSLPACGSLRSDNSGVQALHVTGPHDGDRRILTMVTFGIQWSLMSEAPWQSIQISVYVESQTGNTAGFLCGLITHGIYPKWG